MHRQGAKGDDTFPLVGAVRWAWFGLIAVEE